jgi:hypothetical protein
MPPAPPDLSQLTTRLEEYQVRYVLIGGMAVALYGGARVTQDVDFAIALSEDNRSRVVQALSVFNPRHLRSNSAAAWSPELIISPRSIWNTDAGRVDLVVRLLGVDSFDGLYQRAILVPFESGAIRVASLDDMIAMKSATDRPHDRFDLETLLALKRLSTTVTPPPPEPSPGD